MHTLNQSALAHAVAADYVATARRRAKAGRRQHPPPRRWAAYAVARLARALDGPSARRAVV
jgi:hypothetical protein